MGVTPSIPGMSPGITVSMADCGKGVRHLGQTSPASCGRMTAAQEGHWKMLPSVIREHLAEERLAAARGVKAEYREAENRERDCKGCRGIGQCRLQGHRRVVQHLVDEERDDQG